MASSGYGRQHRLSSIHETERTPPSPLSSPGSAGPLLVTFERDQPHPLNQQVTRSRLDGWRTVLQWLAQARSCIHTSAFLAASFWHLRPRTPGWVVPLC